MILTVSAFLEGINELLSAERCFVTGEVSEWKVYPSGIYFSVKDKEDGSVLRCYMHPSVFRSAGVQVEVGMEVKLGGSPSIYKPTGQFNFRANSIELMGEGALKKAYELLLKKLQEEGLFTRKRPTPERIEKIGIISSRGGVVIQDFRKNLLPLGFKLYFADSRVEGAQAVPELVRAIKRFNVAMPDLDVIIIIRGGGSLESMQAFNNELVCREIFASKIPVVAGIGHDVDVPIATMVADASVSTPTAAAHFMNRSWDAFRGSVEDYERRIVGAFEDGLAAYERRVDRALNVMFGGLRHIFVLFADLEKRFLRGVYSVPQWITRLEEKVGKFEQLLVFADPKRNLRLGYSIVFDEKGKVVKKAKDLKKGDVMRSSFAEGEVVSEVTQIL